MTQASEVYGWQFTPSYFDVVVKTLQLNPDSSSTAPMGSLLAPVAVPMPSTTAGAGSYDLQRRSSPPPLVEGALYGQYIPKSIYPPQPDAPNPEDLAWPQAAHVFFPGVNFEKKSKTECWFFPTHWTGRVSDKNTIAAIPLMGYMEKGLYVHLSVASRLGARPPYTPAHMDNVHWRTYSAQDFASLFHPPTGSSYLALAVTAIKDEAKVSYEWDQEIRDTIDAFPDQGPGLQSEFPVTNSPYIIPNVSWAQVVEYMDSVYKVMLNFDADFQRSLFDTFGSAETAEKVIEQTQFHFSSGYNRDQVSVEALTWWGMAHTEWLEAYKSLVQVASIKKLYELTEKYTYSTQPEEWENVFRGLAFPFETPDGPAIVRGDQLRVRGGEENMTSDGRAFYDKYILPIIEATKEGFEAPKMTLDEAETAQDEAEQAEKTAREASSPQGDASKNLTKARQAARSAEDAADKAREKSKEANKALAEFISTADYKKWEKLEAQRNSLLEMDIDVPDDLIKKIAEAAKVLGDGFPKAKAAAKKAEDKMVKTGEKVGTTFAEEEAAEGLFDKVKAAYEAAKVATEGIKKTVNILRALESHLYLPSYGGYAQFLHDVRDHYDAKRTSAGSVGASFRWFSGSPQAAAKQSGRWSAESEWSQRNAAANSAAIAKSKPQIGMFGGPTRVGPKRTPVAAGPIDITMMDGSQRQYRAGRPSVMKKGSHVVFEDLAVHFGKEFVPLFDAYKANFPDREVEAGYENLVFEVTVEAATNEVGEWMVGVQPVAFFDPAFTPILPFEAGLPDVPFGETDMPILPTDDFVTLPKTFRTPLLKASKKEKKKGKKEKKQAPPPTVQLKDLF
jgi:hypothetical protein